MLRRVLHNTLARQCAQSRAFGRGATRAFTKKSAIGTISLGLLSTVAVYTLFSNNAASPVTLHAEEVQSPTNATTGASAVMSEQDKQELRELLKGKRLEELKITLYQYQVCPFCCKVRAFFDYYNIPYTVVEVDPMRKGELKFSTYKKVPVVMVEGQKQINDSSFIISAFTELLSQQNLISLNNTCDKSEELKWREWVDHKLVHMLPPNIYRTYEEAQQAFEYISDMNNFSYFQRISAKYAGSAAMWAVSKRLKKRHNIDDEREALYECAREWTAALGSRTFLGGAKPNTADLAVYGVLTSIEGLDAFNDMMKNSNIGTWYLRMKQSVGKPSRTNPISV